MAWLKGAVGIAAAYALALQMLLAGIAATTMAAATDPADPFVICYGSHQPDGAEPGGKTTPRINHASCIVCAAAGFAPPLPASAVSTVVRRTVLASYRPAAPERPAALHRHEPRTSQGPPQTA